MMLSIQRVEDAGNLQKERIVLEALDAIDIGKYTLFSCVREDAYSVSDENVPSAFWFPDLNVESGDLVVLYSKAGSASVKKNKSGKSSYFYYWGKDDVVWKSGRKPVLLEVASFAIGEDVKVTA